MAEVTEDLLIHIKNGFARNMQMLGDNAGSVNMALNTNLVNLNLRGNKPIVEPDAAEGLGLSTMLTRIDPNSQVHIAAQNQALIQSLVNKIGS